MEIAGAIVPLNFSVAYFFPYARLIEALRYFCGPGSFELAPDEAPGAGLALHENLQFTGSEEEFEHLCVFLTYQHEQFHARHFTTSPLGLALYLVGARQYAYIYQHLRKWGERMAQEPARDLRCPLMQHRLADPEIEGIANTRQTFGLFQFMLTGLGQGLTLAQARDTVFPAFASTMETLCRGALGEAASYPQVRVSGDESNLVTVGAMTGEAVIEGLARCNELLAAVLLGAPLETLNRYLALKGHGVYKVALGILEKQLGLKAPVSWQVTAKLADWALQAPLFPFLLAGRDSVTLEELLPAWRFFFLISRFGQYGFVPEDLQKDERHVATVIFAGLGWENPWQIAKRIREARLTPPKSALTRHYVENLQFGAALRDTSPAVLAYPLLGDQGHRLGALYNIFSDQIVSGTTGKLASEPDSIAIIASFLSDATADGLLDAADLGRALAFARLLAEFTKNPTKPGALVGKHLVAVVGQSAALRLLKSMGWLET